MTNQLLVGLSRQSRQSVAQFQGATPGSKYCCRSEQRLSCAEPLPMRFSTPSDDDAWDHCESLRVLLCDAQESAVPVHLRTLANGTPYLTMAGSSTSELLSVHDMPMHAGFAISSRAQWKEFSEFIERTVLLQYAGVVYERAMSFPAEACPARTADNRSDISCLCSGAKTGPNGARRVGRR